MVQADAARWVRKEAIAEWQDRALAAAVVAILVASRQMTSRIAREFVLVSCDATERVLLTSCSMYVQARCTRCDRGDGEWECCAVLGG